MAVDYATSAKPPKAAAVSASAPVTVKMTKCAPPQRKQRSTGYSRHYDKPRQEISTVLKYLVFFGNFAFLLTGATLGLLGAYLCAQERRSVGELADIVLNPAVVAMLVGGVVALVALFGCVGALRENICLLKTFTLLMFLSYIVLVLATFVLFLLFYSDTEQGVSANTLLLNAVQGYHRNDNLKDFIDTVQEHLSCCGVTSHSQGFRDWELSAQFNCSPANPYPEFRCGVPHSCCRKLAAPEAAGGGHDRLLLLPPASMHSYQCWQRAQEKTHKELENVINMRGCLAPLQDLFQGHAVHIGVVVGGLIIPMCVSVFLANLFAKQIDRQKYLLEREARREERRKRKRHHRLQDPFQATHAVPLSSSGVVVPMQTTTPVYKTSGHPPPTVDEEHAAVSSTSPTGATDDVYENVAATAAAAAAEQASGLAGERGQRKASKSAQRDSRHAGGAADKNRVPTDRPRRPRRRSRHQTQPPRVDSDGGGRVRPKSQTRNKTSDPPPPPATGDRSTRHETTSPSRPKRSSDPGPSTAVPVGAGKWTTQPRAPHRTTTETMANNGRPPFGHANRRRPVDDSRRRSIAVPIYDDSFHDRQRAAGAVPPPNKRNSVSNWLSQNDFLVIDPKDRDVE